MSVLVLQVALSFHSLLEGLGQGAAPTAGSAAQMLLLITFHKGLTAFALGSSLHHASLSCGLALTLTLTLTLTPTRTRTLTLPLTRCGLTTSLAAVFVLATPLEP